METSFDHLGVGVFETFRARKVAEKTFSILGFKLHLSRLACGAALTGCAPPLQSELQSELEKVLAEAAGDMRIRVVADRRGWTVSAEKFREKQFGLGVAVCSVNAVRNLPEFKSCSALVSVLAREKAERAKCFEAILVDESGMAREGAWSNFFWLASDGIWRTPATRILPGITRSLVLALLKREGSRAEECDVSLSDLMRNCHALFLTQATNGIVPVATIDAAPLSAAGTAAVGNLCDSLVADIAARARRSAVGWNEDRLGNAWLALTRADKPQ